MSVKIRLRRAGSTNKPFYRVVVADARHPIKGRFIEMLGWYDPKKRKENCSIQLERVDYWTGRGAQMSDTVKSLVKKQRMAPAQDLPEPDAAPEEAPAAVAAEPAPPPADTAAPPVEAATVAEEEPAKTPEA
jgi:small subunit ribosomal protein S16